jgi:hypothetical protein
MVTHLRKIPTNPVVFTYNSNNDSTPVILVTSLLHGEDNPGFIGVNLSYVDPLDRKRVLTTYYLNENKEEFWNNVKHLCAQATRRYNYNKIGFFIYRGNIQDHNLELDPMALYE